ncbi:MAG: NADAR family protein [Patescibacteria group bacterium]
MNKVLFYGGSWYSFSNFSAFAVYWRGARWMTSEHAYQAAKFEDPEIIGMIQMATSAHEAKQIAKANKEHTRPNWHQVNLGIMREIVRAKLYQHAYIQKKLLETGDMEIIEDSPYDAFWARGPNGDGQNNLGKIWMELRAELREKAKRQP